MDGGELLDGCWSYSGTPGAWEEACLPHAWGAPASGSACPWRQAVYRREVVTGSCWQGRRVLVEVECAAEDCAVWVNGRRAGGGAGLWPSLSVDVAPFLAPPGGRNVLELRMGARGGGACRAVHVHVKNAIYIEDIQVETRGNALSSRVALSADASGLGYAVRQEVVPAGNVEAALVLGAERRVVLRAAADGGEPDVLAQMVAGVRGRFALTAAQPAGAVLWTPASPALSVLRTELLDGDGMVADGRAVRFGFGGGHIPVQKGSRVMEYRPRADAPAAALRQDADTLAYRLGLGAVYVPAPYPPRHFIGRCDEVGLAVLLPPPAGGGNAREQLWRHPSVLFAAEEPESLEPAGGEACRWLQAAP